jgi:hypothetical protein
MFDIAINKTLESIVRGKKVAVIGPAPYLKGKKLGKVLEGYDVVCRINEFMTPEDLVQDYGKRTDIMFHNFGTPWMKPHKEKIENNQDCFKQLKLVVCPAIKSEHAETNYLSWSDDYVSNVVRNFNDVETGDVPFYWLGIRDYKKIYSSVGAESNTGMLAIMMLLHYPIKELLVSGFTFYLGGNTYDDLYYRGHFPQEHIDGNTFGIHAGHGYHANMRQIEVFRILCSKFGPTIKVDSYINNLLQMQHPSLLKIEE